MQAYFKEREKPISNDENKKKITKEKMMVIYVYLLNL
jgi:hypothetical protein